MKIWNKNFLAIALIALMILHGSVTAFAFVNTSVNPNGAGEIVETSQGDNRVFTQTPNEGYEFVEWTYCYNDGDGMQDAQPTSDNPLIVPSEDGYIDYSITANYREVPQETTQQTDSSSSSSSNDSSQFEPVEITYYEPEPKQEEPSEPPAPPVTIVSTAAGSALPTAGLGTAAVSTKSVSLNLYQMTPAQYVNFVVATVEATPAGGETIIDLNTASCLNAKMAQIISGRSDVTVNIIYIENGVRKLIRIPAGSDVSALLDANGFIGFTALANVFGATEIVQ